MPGISEKINTVLLIVILLMLAYSMRHQPSEAEGFNK
jgi:hypothetical protein